VRYESPRYTYPRTQCSGSCSYEFGSGSLTDDLYHNGVVFWNLADSKSRPPPWVIALLKVMFFGYTLLLPIFDEDEAVYLSKVQERYWRWRQIIRQFINRLFERGHPSTD
jgi:hypothetical protein